MNVYELGVDLAGVTRRKNRSIVPEAAVLRSTRVRVGPQSKCLDQFGRVASVAGIIIGVHPNIMNHSNSNLNFSNIGCATSGCREEKRSIAASLACAQYVVASLIFPEVGIGSSLKV